MSEFSEQQSSGFQAGWLDGKLYDSIFIFGVALTALASGAIVLYRPDLFYPVLLADIWLLGYHHVIATFTKLGGTKEDREENAFLIYYLPIIVLAAVFALYFSLGIWSIVTVYFFWQWFHYTRQAYGISVFYRRKIKNVFTENKWLTILSVWSIPAWGLLHRGSQGWDEFLSLPVFIPLVPKSIVLLAAGVAIFSIAWWLWNCFLNFKKGTLSLAYMYFMFSHMIIFLWDMS